MENYSLNRRRHLGEYAKERGIVCGGKYNDREYAHILRVEDGDAVGTVCRDNLIAGVESDLLPKLHRDAHHLNSSQVLCYNYFRPLITAECRPMPALIELLHSVGIEVSTEARCAFEYKDEMGDDTQFDFYVEDAQTRVYFEIKYTESSFGGAVKDESHRNKFDTTYCKALSRVQCLTAKPSFDEYTADYQLYRYAIRLTNKRKYVILLYPRDNKRVRRGAESFVKQRITEEYRDNMVLLHWEDIVAPDSELYTKYFR
ncbi:MAG: hypothetical protein IKW36_06405 [Alistipes sp.]|nr:hypothetical protein [Alistipes sp.]